MYAVKVGEGSPVGLVQYAMHGREFITARLAFHHYKIGVARGSCWLIPLINPDGALLSERGIESAPNAHRQTLLDMNVGEDFSLWKANGRGVDLNVNFPARWGKGMKNTRMTGAENYIGKSPFSEPETRALRNFTLKIRPDYTISYHTKGEEIYWYFYQSTRTCPRDMSLASVLSQATGYPLAQAKGSAGGYKDWCIQRLGIPAFTIEAGSNDFDHPLGENALEDIIEKNGTAIYALSREMQDK
ncbi:MAG: peptidase [Clostridiales bacterium]|nr:peptidase [Clostridiales bacterium]